MEHQELKELQRIVRLNESSLDRLKRLVEELDKFEADVFREEPGPTGGKKDESFAA